MTAAELLRPPAHRLPLIAAGGVLLTTGVVLTRSRLEELPGAVALLVFSVAAAVTGGLGVLARTEGGRPTASQSVLLVCGLLLAYLGLRELAALLGADDPSDSPALTWTALVLGALALYPARRHDSAICGMIAAVAFGVTLLAGVDWTIGLGEAGLRWLLLLEAIVLVLVSLVLRGGSPRQAELLIVVAGLATLAIPAFAGGELLLGLGGGELLPGFWELVVLVAGCGLIAYGAVDRAHGAAWLGVVHLAAFVLLASDDADETLRWWPLVLLALGAGAMAAGLRPRRPLPPEPAGYAVDRPLASRAGDDDVIQVRNEDPPDR